MSANSAPTYLLGASTTGCALDSSRVDIAADVPTISWRTTCDSGPKTSSIVRPLHFLR